MSVKILPGDCRDVLKTLPSDSVHCCVTSPPYWGLRDYGVSGQIGLESTFTDFISEMVGVFREVRRVLRPDGTLWLNLGDSYAAGKCGRDDEDEANLRRRFEAYGTGRPTAGRKGANGQPRKATDGLKPKDLVGIPWRTALAIQADGWWLRQDIIWAKPNPMPESVSDRCTKSHEYLFLFSKSARYHFAAEAIREDGPTYTRQPGHRSDGASEYVQGRHTNFSTRVVETTGHNKRSVWEIATSPFPEAHFATFPPALVEPCIKAGTSEKGCCGKCGAPWVRNVEREVNATGAGREHIAGGDRTIGQGWEGVPRATVSTTTLGWSPTCTCQAPVVPCTVLDPFGGAGTTALVADRLQRNAILIELNPQYAEMAKRRVFSDAPLFQAAE